MPLLVTYRRQTLQSSTNSLTTTSLSWSGSPKICRNSATFLHRPYSSWFCGVADERQQQRNSNATPPAHTIHGVAVLRYCGRDAPTVQLKCNVPSPCGSWGRVKSGGVAFKFCPHTTPALSLLHRVHHHFRSLLCTTQTHKFSLTYQQE